MTEIATPKPKPHPLAYNGIAVAVLLFATLALMIWFATHGDVAMTVVNAAMLVALTIERVGARICATVIATAIATGPRYAGDVHGRIRKARREMGA